MYMRKQISFKSLNLMENFDKPIKIAGSLPMCEVCFKVFKNTHSLTCHKTTDCGKPKRHHCSNCGYKTCRKNDLKRHMVLKHQKYME